MIHFPTGTPPSRTNKATLLNEKMLDLAQELLFEEMTDDTLVTCGHTFTYRTLGRYGRYETFDGQVIAFEPRSDVCFTIICEEFIITSSLAMIKMISYHLDAYDLTIDR